MSSGQLLIMKISLSDICRQHTSSTCVTDVIFHLTDNPQMILIKGSFLNAQVQHVCFMSPTGCRNCKVGRYLLDTVRWCCIVHYIDWIFTAAVRESLYSTCLCACVFLIQFPSLPMLCVYSVLFWQMLYSHYFICLFAGSVYTAYNCLGLAFPS